MIERLSALPLVADLPVVFRGLRECFTGESYGMGFGTSVRLYYAKKGC